MDGKTFISMMALQQGKPLGKTVKSFYSDPQAIFNDPFRMGNNILVMCDAYTPASEPIPNNKRDNGFS
ncbi:putative glutamine synthetase [Helianthus annuus]|nr:putative glutamine synthetase [Helianthus annuus]